MPKENIELNIKVKSFILRRYLKIFHLEILIFKWKFKNFIVKSNQVELKKPIRMFDNKYIKDKVGMDYEYSI